MLGPGKQGKQKLPIIDFKKIKLDIFCAVAQMVDNMAMQLKWKKMLHYNIKIKMYKIRKNIVSTIYELATEHHL